MVGSIAGCSLWREINPSLPTSEIADQTDVGDALNITLIQHESCPWSYFWCVVETGINDAAQHLDVNVTIKRPNEYDPEAVKTIVETELDRIKALSPAAQAQQAIGVAVIDADRLRQPLTHLIQQMDIPVLAYNAGAGAATDKIPYLTYIGQNDELAGYAAGVKLAQQGYSQGVCIMHQANAPNLQARCDGFQRAMDDFGKTVIRLESRPNSAQSESIIRRFLGNHPDADIFLTVGPKGAAPFYRAMESVKRTPGSYVHGSFDLSTLTLDAIKKGTTLFTVDQQPYLEGYLAVQWLTWIRRHQFSPPDEIVSTGPHFVDANSIDTVMAQVGQYR